MTIKEIKATREYNDLLNMYLDDGFSVKTAVKMALHDMLMAVK